MLCLFICFKFEMDEIIKWWLHFIKEGNTDLWDVSLINFKTRYNVKHKLSKLWSKCNICYYMASFAITFSFFLTCIKCTQHLNSIILYIATSCYWSGEPQIPVYLKRESVFQAWKSLASTMRLSRALLITIICIKQLLKIRGK